MPQIKLIALILLCAVSSIAFAADDDHQPAPKNVVLCVVDDMGFQAGCYGDAVARTPGIDRLAAEGTRFTRAYCTTSSCSASRSVLLSGLYNHAIGHYGHSHGYNHFSTYETVRSLPVILAEAGYRTCSIGKYHLAPEHVYHFETYANDGIQGSRNPVRMARNGREWIEAGGDRPFFLYFCTTDPHRGAGPGKFANFNNDASHYPGVKPVRYEPSEIPVPPWLPDEPEVRRELAEFYQSISRADQGVNALIDALHETGHWDDTLFILLSDNGPPFPGAKTTLYEPGTNLPLIVRDPGQKQTGIACDARVTWADVTPTILDYCGVEPKPSSPVAPVPFEGQPQTAGKTEPYRFHGRSFLPAIGSVHPEGFDEAYFSHTFHEITMYYPMRAVISGKYKYILNLAHELPYPFASDLYRSPTWQAVLERKPERYGKRTVEAYLHRPRHELYDLEADPDEVHNLADRAEHRQSLEALQAKLKAFQERTHDPWILKWEYE